MTSTSGISVGATLTGIGMVVDPIHGAGTIGTWRPRLELRPGGTRNLLAAFRSRPRRDARIRSRRWLRLRLRRSLDGRARPRARRPARAAPEMAFHGAGGTP